MVILICLKKYTTIYYQIYVNINGFCFSNDSNINTSLNFTSDGIHLNKRYSVPKLARNLCESVGIYVQKTNIAMSLIITMDGSDLEKLTLQLLLMGERDNLTKIMQDCLIIITTDLDLHMIIS